MRHPDRRSFWVFRISCLGQVLAPAAFSSSPSILKRSEKSRFHWSGVFILSPAETVPNAPKPSRPEKPPVAPSLGTSLEPLCQSNRHWIQRYSRPAGRRHTRQATPHIIDADFRPQPQPAALRKARLRGRFRGPPLIHMVWQPQMCSMRI